MKYGGEFRNNEGIQVFFSSRVKLAGEVILMVL